MPQYGSNPEWQPTPQQQQSRLHPQVTPLMPSKYKKRGLGKSKIK
jgi:hypothetical protein